MKATATKQIIAIEDIEYLIRKLKEFNGLDLKRVQLTRNGRSIKMPEIERAKYVANTAYVGMLEFLNKDSVR